MSRRTMTAFAVLVTGAIAGMSSVFAQAEGVISIDTSKALYKVSPTLYGIFFEEINRAGEGGIYAEMIQNRSFEDNGANPLAWGKTNAEINLERTNPLNIKNPTYLNVFTRDGGAVLNGGFVRDFNETKQGAIALTQGDKYDLSFYATGAKDVKLTVSLLDGSKQPVATQDVTISGRDWKKYTVTLTASKTITDGVLELKTAKASRFTLDMVSLFPQKTWKGRKNGMRPDLMERLAAMKPAFVRFPGGCFVEGSGFVNRNIWKNSVGPIEERVRQYNGNWGYCISNGLGFHEYLQMCEDLNAEPLFVINCGMGHATGWRGMYAVPMDEMDEFVQDALDAIEYANGDVNTKWGKLRAQNGHPAPFNLKYMEIGNENGGNDYRERYILMHKAIMEKYPYMHLIANEATRGFKNEIVDPHMYSNPSAFFRDSTRFDNYDRNDAKIYFGEYAVTSGSGQGNLIAAVSESAFMCGLERNSDIVIMSSYAPLFVRTGWGAWNPNAIVFDQSRSYGTPSYWAQAMFANNLPDENYKFTMTAPEAKAVDVAGKIGLGTYQTQAEFKDIKVVKDGKTLFESDFAKNGMQGWRRTAGAWSVDGDVIKQTSNDNNTAIFFGDPTWDNYTLTLKARKTDGAEGFLISFGVKNTEMRRWNIGGWSNASHAIEADDFRAEHVNGTIETGRWYDIKIELQKDTVKLYLDNKLLQTSKRLTDKSLAATAGVDNKAGETILKFVNGSDQPLTYTVNSGKSGAVGNVKAITLTGTDQMAENTYDNPERIAPKESSVQANASSFKYTFPAYSVTILRWKK